MKKVYFAEKKRGKKRWFLVMAFVAILMAGGVSIYWQKSDKLFESATSISIGGSVANAQVGQPADPAKAADPAQAAAQTQAASQIPQASQQKTAPAGNQIPGNKPAPAKEVAADKNDNKKAEANGKKKKIAMPADEGRLKAMQEELRFKSEKLTEIRQDIAKDLEEVKKLQGLIDEKIKEEQKIAEQKSDVQMARLIKIVGSMRAENAAKLLTEVDADITVTILSSLSGAKSSKIIGNMDPDKAAKISKRMVTERLTPRMKELTESWQGMLGNSKQNGSKSTGADGK